MSRVQVSWERKCWHLGTRRFACEADAQVALARELKGKPTWLEVHHDVVAHPRHAGKGRPRKEAYPTTYQWQIVVTVTVNQQRVDEEALRKACLIVGTNELVKTYKDQGGVESGFHFLKDPLFLASSVTVSKPERIIALPFDHGALLAGLSFSRIPAAGTLGRERADDSRPGTQTYSTSNDAVGLSMF